MFVCLFVWFFFVFFGGGSWGDCLFVCFVCWVVRCNIMVVKNYCDGVKNALYLSIDHIDGCWGVSLFVSWGRYSLSLHNVFPKF